MFHKTIEKIFHEFKTSEKGLTEEEANKRLKIYGKNSIIAKKKKSLILEFLKEFQDLMVIILIIAALIAGIAGEKTDALVILFIVILNALIGFTQKYKAEKAIEALKKMVSAKARVIRDGKEMQIDAEYLVPGDILLLNEGDKITADARLIEVNELSVSEATLTGESTPVSKTTETIEINTAHAEAKNIVFMGTLVTRGTAKAIVTHTGMNTEFGKIAHLTTSTKKDKSPLEKEMRRIGVFVGKITLIISVFLFIVGFFIQGKDFISTFLFATAVAVAAVPEGLPATITIALALGVQKLARHNAIVKQLSSVETLGSTTVICSDKTGTLTKNEMTVREIYLDNFHINVTGVGYNPEGALHFQSGNKLISLAKTPDDLYDAFEDINLNQLKKLNPAIYNSLELINKIGVYCNNANLNMENKSNWFILGDPTEGSLLTLAEKSGFPLKNLRKNLNKIKEIPFDSDRKRMSVINKEKNLTVYTKGAPDSIFQICTQYLDKSGQPKPLTKSIKQRLLKTNEEMAGKALRVLALAYKELENTSKTKNYTQEETENNLIFVGLIGIIDPPRPEVKDAVKLTKEAGIKTYIVTGDHGLTANAIATQLGLVEKDKAKIITGVELSKMTEKELLKNFKKEKYIIFARVSPEHKLKIVSTLKSKGEIVAVTGDGVNDAPALKRADIGIAMGITGTDVSKEASNMVLADDSFSTIVTAIKEGRTIYENLKKFIFFIFSCNIGELLTVFAAIIFGFPAPLTAILILSVDLGTDVLPALALGIDPPEPGIMQKTPRNPKEHIMKKRYIYRFLYLGLFIGGIVISTYLWSLHQYGWQWGQELSEDSFIYLKATTTAFVTLVLIQMINTFNARSENLSIFKLGFFSNKWLIASIMISLIFVLMITNIPFFQNAIHTTSLNLKEWIIIIISSFAILIIEETRKLIVKINSK